MYIQYVTVACKNEKCGWNNAWGFSIVVQEVDGHLFQTTKLNESEDFKSVALMVLPGSITM